MTSNCYIVWDDVTKCTICIDPASEFSLRETAFIEENGLHLDYIILTHEHTDHTWGVNALLDKYDSKVICSEACKNNLLEAGNMYFRLYYERENYTYAVRRVDYTTESLNHILTWGEHTVRFVPTPGHSMGSICIDLDGCLFTGDTIMQYKAYVNKRNGSFELYKQSIQMIVGTYPNETNIYPGHGEPFMLKDKDDIKK
ncbi:glyoxylase-like metal-dependent hydrolase (beta-lactamase superfamily II) [Bacteroides zoogleoformans]|nr:glyoxylase-like metal-dependent hydrolase (beta-lactamase superfamily II) [Bacteroides zoogleoformans]